METTTPLEVGQAAPDFKLKGPGGQPVTLSEYRGRKHVVLVFFSLAFSGVCSHHLPMVQRELRRLEDLDATVLGISVDSHWANSEFAKRLGLDFPLLSDLQREASAAYGMLIPEAGHAGRGVFVIDKRGTVVYRDVSSAPADPDRIPGLEGVVRALEGLA